MHAHTTQLYLQLRIQRPNRPRDDHHFSHRMPPTNTLQIFSTTSCNCCSQGCHRRLGLHRRMDLRTLSQMSGPFPGIFFTWQSSQIGYVWSWLLCACPLPDPRTLISSTRTQDFFFCVRRLEDKPHFPGQPLVTEEVVFLRTIRHQFVNYCSKMWVIKLTSSFDWGRLGPVIEGPNMVLGKIEYCSGTAHETLSFPCPKSKSKNVYFTMVSHESKMAADYTW